LSSTINSPETKGIRTQTRSLNNKKPRSEAARSAKVAKKTVSARSLEDWLDAQGLPVRATVKVNGPSQEAAILTVDLGSPLSGPVRLSPEQSSELTSRMIRLASELYVGEVPMKVSYDQPNGIYWTSLR
jgi:hypothetical protein